jgi:hypothetical protein
MQFTLPEIHTCQECLPTDIDISYETSDVTLHRPIISDATQYVIANVSHVGNTTQFLQNHMRGNTVLATSKCRITVVHLHLCRFIYTDLCVTNT